MKSSKTLTVTWWEKKMRFFTVLLSTWWHPHLLNFSLILLLRQWRQLRYVFIISPNITIYFRHRSGPISWIYYRYMEILIFVPQVRIQTSDYANNLRECFPKMKAEEGIGTFYKGLAPLWMRQIPYTMMKFSCFEKTVEAIYANVMPKPRAQCTAVFIILFIVSFYKVAFRVSNWALPSPLVTLPVFSAPLYPTQPIPSYQFLTRTQDQVPDRCSRILDQRVYGRDLLPVSSWSVHSPLCNGSSTMESRSPWTSHVHHHQQCQNHWKRSSVLQNNLLSTSKQPIYWSYWTFHFKLHSVLPYLNLTTCSNPR